MPERGKNRDFIILAEDKSDAETLKVIVGRLLPEDTSPTIKLKGYGSCGELRRKGARDIRMFAGEGWRRFIVCHDADGDPAESRHQLVSDKVLGPSDLKPDRCCIVIPVQEIEAWILADLGAAANVITSWKPAAVRNPESIIDPKEDLERRSRAANNKPRYVHAIHNLQVAAHLDLDKVYKACPSFRPLSDFVKPPPAAPTVAGSGARRRTRPGDKIAPT